MLDLTRSHITIRTLERADVPALLEIIRAARAQYGLAERVDSLLEPADFALFDTYSRRRAIYFVALVDGEVAGGAGIAPLAGLDPLTCELQRMYLKPEARGQGVGTRLLEACLDAARRFWFVRCYAETISQMDQALKLYTRLGFAELSAALADTGHAHNDRWLLRDLKAPQEQL
jgi:putative acetyltransferase